MRYVNLILSGVLLLGFVTSESFAQGRGFRGGRGSGGQGPDKEFVADREDFHFLLEHHDQIIREVKQLEDGVETITESENKDVAKRIQKHVAAMYQRVEKQRPIRRRDPLFAEIFRYSDKITMKVEKTPKGVRVTERSDDHYVAKLIQAHAKVVSAFAKYGFLEAHKQHPIPERPQPAAAAATDSLEQAGQ